ncbi:MAG: redoxin family protein [Alphaproteobacteria bacterium]|nr:redoxin family protein [Alphaproteobacteria bacterium]MCB9688121.1 redoxin family protein [Alphaproteobacteria bacterium]
MVWWLVAAHAVEIGDREDALYLERTGRGEEAAGWLLEHRDDDPTSVGTLYDWLRIAGWERDLRNPALLTQVRRWSDAHPKAEDAPIAIAAATAWRSLDPRSGSALYPEPGPWCDDVRAVLDVAPQSGSARYRILWEQTLVERRCGAPVEPIEAAMRELALTGDAGIGPLAWWSVDDGVDEADVELVRRALDDDPTRLDDYRKLAKPVEDDEEPGPGRDAVRELLIERARALVSDPRPSRVAAAIAVLSAAGLTEETRAARVRLGELDPENRSNQWSLEHPPDADGSDDEEEKEPEVDADTVLEPAARLAALQAQDPPKGSWEGRVYWQARADAAASLGDLEEEYAALKRLDQTDTRLVRVALLSGRAKEANKLADRIVDRMDAPRYRLSADGRTDDRWITDRAEALDVRAAVLATRGKPELAADDLEEAMLLVPATPDQLLRLGLLYAELDRDRDAAPLIGAGLVGLPADDPRHDRAVAALGECLGSLEGWVPTTDDWLDAMRERQERLAAEPATDEDLPWDDGRFTDLVMAIDGQEQRLFDVQGPIVLDVWATWCGPCMKSLPHLDQLARTYEGRVTFVAVSVDEQQDVADRYLDRRGGTSFRRAWIGGDGMQKLGVDGIPAMFVFDAEHRLVERLLGWGPGSTSLDDAIEEALTR